MSVTVHRVSKSFGGQTVLNDIRFAFPDGEVTALTGPSGSGKTTLLFIMLGLMKPDAGEVTGMDAKRIGVVFQEDRLIEHMTAAANVELVQRHGADMPAADAILSSVGLDPRDTKRVLKYSGGQRRRVAIARALAVKPQLLFLDEPFKGLDERAREMTIRAIRQYASGATIVLISHDRLDAELMGAGHELRLSDVPAVRDA